MRDQLDSVVLFLDILGYKSLLENEEDFNNLFLVIKNIREQNTNEFQIEYRSNQGSHSMKAMPIITSFSDSVVLSVPVKEIKEPWNIGNIVNILLGFVQQLADSLMIGGYILRGGMARGELYHKDGVIFGKALIEAYELEKKAKNPKILVSDALAKEYNACSFGENNFLSKEIINGKEEHYLDYLKLSFQGLKNRERYKKNTENTIRKTKENILSKMDKGCFHQLEQDFEVLRKWINFENYIKKAITVDDS